MTGVPGTLRSGGSDGIWSGKRAAKATPSHARCARRSQEIGRDSPLIGKVGGYGVVMVLGDLADLALEEEEAAGDGPTSLGSLLTSSCFLVFSRSSINIAVVTDRRVESV